MEIRHAVKRKSGYLDERPEGLCDVVEAGDGGFREAAPRMSCIRRNEAG